MKIFEKFFSFFLGDKKEDGPNEKTEIKVSAGRKKQEKGFNRDLYIIEFLDYVKGRTLTGLDRVSAFEYMEKLGSFQDAFDDVLEKKWLKESDPYERLDSLKVSELKEILKEKSLKVSGRKSELIERLKINVPEEEFEYIEGTYVLTLAGESVIKEHRERIELSYNNLRKNTLKSVKERDFKKAYFLVNQHNEITRSDLFDTPTLGISLGAERTLQMARIIEDTELSYIENGEEYTTLMKDYILLNYFLSGISASKNLVAQFIEDAKEELLSPKLEKSMYVVFKDKYVTEVNSILEYFRYILFRANSAANQLQSKDLGIPYEKIGMEDCPVCNGHEKLNKGLLPYDIGCNCTLIAKFD